MAVLTRDGVKVTDLDGQAGGRARSHHVTWDPIMAEKGGYKHFMQKEIYEQPRAVRDTILGRISQDTGKVFLDEMALERRAVPRFSKCAASWPAAPAGMRDWPENS